MYATGYYDQPLPLGSQTLAIDARYTGNIFFFKLNSSGVPQWAKRIGGQNTCIPGALTVSQSGNIILGGNFRTSVTIGNTTLSTSANEPGATEPFVVRYNSAGDVSWIVQTGCGETGWGVANAITTKGSSIYITGTFKGSISFGSYSQNVEGVNMFIAKISE